MSKQPRERVERDSMGEMTVPGWALWGASTQRAVENFPISGRTVPVEVVRAFGRLKAACAQANADLGRLDKKLAEPIITAAGQVARGELDEHFVVDVYQTGSGTSTNMNANEVIANRANQLLGFGIGAKGKQGTVHPNDHVNMGQSSNDTFPTAMRIAGAAAISETLEPALARLREALSAKADAFDKVVKIGRTHLMDATPIRVGQVFSGYARQAQLGEQRAAAAREALAELPIGGTAVGTGINTHADFGKRVAELLSKQTGLDLREAENHFEAQATQDAAVAASAQLKTVAVSLSKIANDIRHLGSGPRCGIGELKLPAIQPGSSIMPGKVNPVICESVMQVTCRVIGNDATIASANLGGVGSIFELNVAMPVMAQALLESAQLLANASDVFVTKLIDGLEVDAERCAALIEQSLMMVTSLAPEIGYDQAAAIAKEGLATGRTIRQLVRERKLLDEAALDRLLDPAGMTRPDEG